MAHQKLYRDQKLAHLFPSLGYPHEKISDAIPKPDIYGLGASMLGTVAECAAKFAAAVKERGVDDSGFISHRIAELEHAIERLNAYFTRDDSGLSPEDARVFHFFVRAKVEQLAKSAREIDDSYME